MPPGRGPLELDELLGTDVPSEVSKQVVYHLESVVARGETASSFFAHRRAPDGQVPVLVKVLLPSFVQRMGDKASLVVTKEAVALGRLNEQVPPTPFVVRLIDTGMLQHPSGVGLPWTAVEHVPGGVLGTTLAQRVKHSVAATGAGFDPARAANAIDCIAQGLSAAHQVSVVHRDLTPRKVLCSGQGASEIFKISDFGAARPVGLAATFAGSLTGTPGYAAPELAEFDEKALGTWTDVFSFAAIAYFLLTGEPYFDPHGDVTRQAEKSERRSVLDSHWLNPALRALEHDCRSIDLTLAWASAAKPDARLAEPLAVAVMIAPHLERAAASATEPRRRISASIPPAMRAPPDRWTWTTLHAASPGSVVRSVAWDGSARAFAVTTRSLRFWNGTGWHDAALAGAPVPEAVRFVRRVAAGRWLLGGDDGTLVVCNADGVTERFAGPDASSRLDAFSGDLEDVAVIASCSPKGLALHALVGKRWLKPLVLPDVAAVSGLTRVDDALWLVTGRGDGGGFAGLYAPLSWEVERLSTPPEVRALLACEGQSAKRRGIATGLSGAVLWREGATTRYEVIDERCDLSAAAIDPLGRGWAASAGRIWVRDPSSEWRLAWEDARARVPFVSLHCDTLLTVAMAADGSILEGRAAPLLEEPTRLT